MISWIALIRAIGPSTYEKMSMQQLRDGCAARGLESVRTYIASGNLLFESPSAPARVLETVTDVLSDHGLDNDVFLRQPRDLDDVITSAPFPDAARDRPNHLLVVFLNETPSEEGITALAERPGPERIRALKRELCIDYADGVGRSKLTPAVIERLLGQPGTARNWNTVGKLAQLSKRSA